MLGLAVSLALLAACQQTQAQVADAPAAVRVVVDAGHNNFHAIEARYAPFAEVLRAQGLAVASNTQPFTDASLAGTEVLVIANAMSLDDLRDPSTPNPSAFTADEIAAVRRFVERGGGLLLIADHMPFAGAANELAAAFGVTFDNGFAIDGDTEPDVFTRQNGGLVEDPLTEGVMQVRSFNGSAFVAPNARPLMRLSARYTIMLPERPGEFSATTPRVSGADRLQAAALELGAGRVAVFGEAAMFTDQTLPNGQRPGFHAPGAEDNARLLINVTNWLAKRD